MTQRYIHVKYYMIMMMRMSMIICTALLLCACDKEVVTKQTSSDAPNILFILSDDHRYDFMGFTGKVPFLETPHMDRMAADGLHLENAFVTTSLCSPSRASILTGKYTHRHQVVDNQSLVPEGTKFFPAYLQEAGYQTGYVGKWHMGNHKDDPRPGFDYWASFRGQGNYWNSDFNVNGERDKPVDSTYVTHAITDYSLDFLEGRDTSKPFFLYVSHKAVHSEFMPAREHVGMYDDEPLSYPPTMYPPDHPRASSAAENYNYDDLPQWVKAQRESWHGVDYMYHGQLEFDEFYRRYCETLVSLDESIGTLLAYLEDNQLLENTLVVYMGDNGFSFGEHGLIDKRQAYEESMRVPMLAMGGVVDTEKDVLSDQVQNIDVAPTFLDLAGIAKPDDMDGTSFLPQLQGQEVEWRDTIYYEYFWERPFPQTPTVHAIRTEQYKYIRYHGIWDLNELYDMKNDPYEMNNLIRDPAYSEVARDLRIALFDWIVESEGNRMYLRPDGNHARYDHGYRGTF